MTDLVSMPKNIVPYLRMIIEQMGSNDEANFAIYHLGFKWGKETVEMSGEKSDIDELKTKTVLTAIHSGITNFDVDINETIRISPYDSIIDDDFFLAGYAAGVVSSLLGEYHIAKIRDGYYDVVKSEKKIKSGLFKEKEKKEGIELENLKQGGSYLIVDDSKDAQRTFDAFLDALQEGMPGLCFTRKFPSKLKERYPEIDSPIFWLSTVDGTEEVKTIKPKDFSDEVTKISSAFLKMKHGIFILHGIEFLITYLEFDEILKTLREVRDLNSAEDGIFLLSVDPEYMDEDNFSRLENEFEVTEKKLGKKMTFIYNLVFWAEEMEIDTLKSYQLISRARDELKVGDIEESERLLNDAIECIFDPFVTALEKDVHKTEMSEHGSLLEKAMDAKEEGDLDEALSLLIEYKKTLEDHRCVL